MSKRLVSTLFIVGTILMTNIPFAAAQIGVKPAQITEQMDDATMLDKASMIFGYNAIRSMVSGMKQQGMKLDADAIIEGARLAAEAQPLDISPEEMRKFNMILGNNTIKGMAKSLDEQGLELSMKGTLKGAILAAKGEELGIAQEDVESIRTGLQAQMREQQMKKTEMVAQENKAAGEAFLNANAAKEGVQQLDNGVQYMVMKEGAGETPNATDQVKLHYHGTNINGEVFDSSVDRDEPITHSASGFVKGFNAAVQAMPQGSKWKVFIPSDLAYGMQGPLGPNQTLIFEIELLDIIKSSDTK